MSSFDGQGSLVGFLCPGSRRMIGKRVQFDDETWAAIRDAVAALPVDSAVLDGEAVIMRPDNSCDFEALRSRQGAGRGDPGCL
jgi:bifunctional non-homologous end joining protein LigD